MFLFGIVSHYIQNESTKYLLFCVNLVILQVFRVFIFYIIFEIPFQPGWSRFLTLKQQKCRVEVDFRLIFISRHCKFGTSRMSQLISQLSVQIFTVTNLEAKFINIRPKLHNFYCNHVTVASPLTHNYVWFSTFLSHICIIP